MENLGNEISLYIIALIFIPILLIKVIVACVLIIDSWCDETIANWKVVAENEKK